MRKVNPVTISADLVPLLWAEIKSARDQAAHEARSAENKRDWLDRLLVSMRAEGMAEHLPTLEEVQAAFRGEQ